MQLVKKHIINRYHQFWSYRDQLAFKSKDLYNAANYIRCEYFFETRKYHTLPSLYHLIKNHETYRALPTKVSKQMQDVPPVPCLLSIPGLRKGLVVLSQRGITLLTKTQTVDLVRIKRTQALLALQLSPS